MENSEQNQQELIMKLGMFEQQMRNIQEQLELVEQNSVDLNSLSLSLEDLKGKSGNEIMAPIGRGIFIKANLISEELIVDVGGKNFVTKDISETKKIIEGQLKKLGEIKTQLDNSLNQMNEEVSEILLDAQKNNK